MKKSLSEKGREVIDEGNEGRQPDELVDLASKAWQNSGCHGKRDLIFPAHSVTQFAEG